MQNFRSLGGLEVSNSLTGIGTEGGRELGTFCVLSRVASQLKTEKYKRDKSDVFYQTIVLDCQE